jgi:membrane protein implicated in regulation of membrane protease activity
MSWLPIGIVFMVILNTGLGIAFLGLGAAYITIGLANKDKWKKKEK